MQYKEIFKLKEMLEKAGIPFEMSSFFDGYQIGYPSLKDDEYTVCSVIEHNGSYGRESDLLEIMGLLTDDEKKFDSLQVGSQQTTYLTESINIGRRNKRMRTNLKVLRVKNSLTQDDMAKKIGCSRVSYSNIERGIRQGSTNVWNSIQQVFNIKDEDMWELMKNEK